jgi:glyoxylase-like metal-dependent hydrolase (beta-lactamase superfamily II)
LNGGDVTLSAPAASWFERRRIGDVTLLWEAHVHPLLRCNIWHVRARDADLLIDTGLGVASLRTAAADLFGSHLIAVATHTHADHGGGMHEFSERWVHAAEADMARSAHYHVPLDLDAWSPERRATIASSGYHVEGGLLTAVPISGYRAGNYRLRGFEPTRLLKEGDVVDLGDRAFEVLHFPGHSPGSIGLYEHATQMLFSGDAIYDGPLLDNLPDSDVVAYRRTMERLLVLPVSIVHAGHDPSFGRERLHALVRAYLDARPAVSVRHDKT